MKQQATMGKERQRTAGKLPVKVRFKKLSDGRRSIYLDCYVGGKRSYEYLHLYLLPETGGNAERQNAATLRKAEAAKKRYMAELRPMLEHERRAMSNNNASLPPSPGDTLLADWFETFYNMQKARGVAHRTKNVKAVAMAIAPTARLKDIDRDFCLSFIDYVRNVYRKADGEPLSAKTAKDYLGELNTALNVAVRSGMKPSNPIALLSPSEKVKTTPGKRDFLTIEEVKRLIATLCDFPLVKQAYLFACNCGLRLGDILRLQWKDIGRDKGQWRLTVLMHKTQRPVYIPLGVQAMRWLPKRGKAEERVFVGVNQSELNLRLRVWAKSAGIEKTVTFHTSRHTYATMLLTLGADIYTVSKLLGHTSIRHTQIYARIVNKKKDDAVNLVDGVID